MTNRIIALAVFLALVGCAAGAHRSEEQNANVLNSKQIIVVGETTKAEVARSMGQASETVSDPDSGDEVWVYSIEVPFFVGFIPVVGDIVDVAETAQKDRELIVWFDKQGVATKFELRELDY
jgi:hypothetical protein